MRDDLPREIGVLVIGAGLAGLCAALSAAEAGAEVLLIEKQPQTGGSSVLSGGGMAFAGVEEQFREGIEDGPEALRADLLRMGGGFSDPALVEAYVAAQADTKRWLQTHGVEFTSLQVGSGNTRPRVLRTRPSQAIGALAASLGRQPRARLITDVRVERLLQGRDGGIGGACARHAGAQADIAVRSGVVLAAGGFSRDATLVRTFAPGMTRATPVGGEGSTGDGLRMGMAVGAGLRDMGFIRATFGSHPAAQGASNLILLAMYKGAIIVGTEGQRFVNESLSYKDLGDACLAQPEPRAFQVFDAQIMSKADPLSVTYDFGSALANGLLLQADTLPALAARIGVDAARLTETVARYNKSVQGEVPDTLGRTALPGGAKLIPISTAPFYAYPTTAVLLSTYCGLAIDAEAHVLDAFGAVVAGLYAAGEVTGGLHGAGYVSGSSLGKAAIMGRIAGRNAAAPPVAA
jgi:fumarate reductase flavoprotein subunit